VVYDPQNGKTNRKLHAIDFGYQKC